MAMSSPKPAPSRRGAEAASTTGAARPGPSWRGRKRATATATATPRPATPHSVARQCHTVSDRPTMGGRAALPRSPVKLYVPSGPRAPAP